MAEPTVQIPVSLIDRAAKAVLRGWDSVAVHAELAALLSQPTPTAEMCPDCSEHAFDGRKCVSCDYRVEQDESAEPPRIEDMAPGTTFTEEVRWTVTGTLSTGSIVAHSGSGEMRFADRFDPSTIRDVTPPADTH